MSEPGNFAKAAREQLAKALNALQTDANVPQELVDAADPIADAMGILHRIEKSDGANLDGRQDALKHVKEALDRLQQITSDHPAVEIVMGAVAVSVTKVNALVRYKPPAAPPPAAITPTPVVAVTSQPAMPSPLAPAAAAAQAPAPAAAQNFAGKGTVRMMESPLKAAAAAPAPAPAYNPPPPPAPAPVAAFNPPPPPAAAAPVVAQPAFSPVAQAYAPPAAQAYAPPPAAQAYAAPPAAQAYAPPPAAQPSPFMAAPAPAPAPAQAFSPAPAPAATPAAGPASRGRPPGGIDVEMGTHSASNFYKGLGGNDVIDHGGIFVATYKIPKLGASVILRVLLPGDLEFQATAVVQWTRDPGGSTEPGYGARFTQISQEGRHLVYRYTRNREPMFYDDL